VKKQVISGASRAGSKSAKGFQGTTRLGRVLIAGAKEMLAHARGEIEPESYTLPGTIDVKVIRENPVCSSRSLRVRLV
jgi:hypothetical protein